MIELTDKEILDFVATNLTLRKEDGHIVLDSILVVVKGNVKGNVMGDVVGNVRGDVNGKKVTNDR
jgi:hypothetical protein